MSLAHVLSRLVEGESLSSDEAAQALRLMVSGEAAEPQVAGVLVALQAKGPTGEELAGMASVLRSHALGLTEEAPGLVDTCGTGGGRPTFNLSTGSAIVAAAAGAKVAKHGNRSVTSKCGSADVLEALGVKLSADPERLSHILRSLGIVFLFAPNHHPAVAKVGHVRRALGIRTVFNLLGPLANPAGAARQLVGVYSRDLLRPMAEALLLLGTERAFVVHSRDGLDEASPCAPTDCVEVRDGQLIESVLDPSDFGLENLQESVLAPGDSVAEAADALRDALTGGGPRSGALVPNSALALVLAGLAGSLPEAAGMARAAIDDGRALAKLEAMAGAADG